MSAEVIYVVRSSGVAGEASCGVVVMTVLLRVLVLEADGVVVEEETNFGLYINVTDGNIL